MVLMDHSEVFCTKETRKRNEMDRNEGANFRKTFCVIQRRGRLIQLAIRGQGIVLDTWGVCILERCLGCHSEDVLLESGGAVKGYLQNLWQGR